jgi:hypothetical protein
MELEWGKKNASLLISATGNEAEKSYDRLYLDVIHRQVCVGHVLKDMMLNRISDTQKHMHKKCEELARIKERTLIGWIRRHIW